MTNILIARSQEPRKRKFPYFLIWVPLILAAGFWAYSQKDRLMMNLKSDPYAEIRGRVDSHTSAESKEWTEASEKTYQLILTLLRDRPDAGPLYVFAGRMAAHKFRIAAEANPAYLRDLFFWSFLERYTIATDLPAAEWDRALLFLRKAAWFELEETDDRQRRETLAWIYFWGGHPYFSEGLLILPEGGSLTRDLLEVLGGSAAPDWNNLSRHYNEVFVTYLSSLHYLRSRNLPMAYAGLNRIINGNQDPELRDTALYLLASLARRERNPRMQLYYLAQIDMAAFGPRLPGYPEELAYLYRFTGRESEAKAVMQRWESLQKTPAPESK